MPWSIQFYPHLSGQGTGMIHLGGSGQTNLRVNGVPHWKPPPPPHPDPPHVYAEILPSGAVFHVRPATFWLQEYLLPHSPPQQFHSRSLWYE